MKRRVAVLISGRGSNMAWQRCRPQRSLPSTAERNSP